MSSNESRQGLGIEFLRLTYMIFCATLFFFCFLYFLVFGSFLYMSVFDYLL